MILILPSPFAAMTRSHAFPLLYLIEFAIRFWTAWLRAALSAIDGRQRLGEYLFRPSMPLFIRSADGILSIADHLRFQTRRIGAN